MPEHAAHMSAVGIAIPASTKPGVIKKKLDLVAAAGNLAIAYNFAVLAICVSIMTAHDDYPEPAWSKYVLLGMAFVGAMAGMVSMGIVGDLLGRRAAMITTLSLVVLGTLGCALFTFGDVTTVYALLSVCRFVTGFGVGGVYPIAAATSAEGVSHGEHEGSRVAWSFIWQTPGNLAPYALAWILVQLPVSPVATSVQFRLLLLVGSLLAAVPLVAAIREGESPAFLALQLRRNHEHMHRPRQPNPLREALRRPEIMRTLIGTCSVWCIYDVAWFGTATFTPSILLSIFGSGTTLNALCWQSLVVGLMGVPAALTAIYLLKPRGGRWLTVWGFALNAVAFAALATAFTVSPDGLQSVKFALFCALQFALNWGPNISIYVLSGTAFPTSVRTSCHGLSAAAGKLGAVVGTAVFTPISNTFGFAAVMWMQVALSIVATVIARAFLPDDGPGAAQLLVEEGADGGGEGGGGGSGGARYGESSALVEGCDADDSSGACAAEQPGVGGIDRAALAAAAALAHHRTNSADAALEPLMTAAHRSTLGRAPSSSGIVSDVAPTGAAC